MAFASGQLVKPDADACRCRNLVTAITPGAEGTSDGKPLLHGCTNGGFSQALQVFLPLRRMSAAAPDHDVPVIASLDLSNFEKEIPKPKP